MPVTKFADIRPVKSGNAGVLQAVDESLEKCGMSIEDQKKKLIMSNFDGASVNMGKKGGVGKLLTDRVPHQVTAQCVAHRLELVCLDTAKGIPYLQQFDETVNSVFKLY